MNRDIIRVDLEEIYRKPIDWLVFEDKSVLITGAYGMLASYLTLFFIYLREEKNIHVRLILLVRSKEKLEHLIGDKDKDYIRVYYDGIIHPLNIEERVDYIIHAASLASPKYYSTCPVDVIEPNAIGTYYLLRLAVEKSVERFLLFSTGDVYGRVENKDVITEEDYGIMSTLDIHNCYSESKRVAETISYSFYSQYEVPISIARIWHTYAPTMDVWNDPRVFASFVKNLLQRKNIEMYSDGAGYRTFCYITDAVYGFLRILIDGDNGEAYNVCNESQLVTIAELAENAVALRPEYGLKVIRKKRDDKEKYVENVHLKGNKIYPSSDKLRKLGWKPEISIETGFDRVLRYFER